MYMKLDNPLGSRGTEGCKILSYLPYKMLSFKWNAPPTIPTLRNANKLTSVVLQFDELSGSSTKVTLTQLGWGQGEVWEECYNYFDNAWSYVLKNLSKRFDDVATDSSTKTANSDKKVYVAIYTAGENWIPGERPSEQPHFQVHYDRIMQGINTGLVLAAGPFADYSGGMTLIHSNSLDEAREFATNDPMVESDVLAVTIQHWAADLSTINRSW